ncbi:MAG TPA: glycoside hydrolase family 127 protein, partial [Chitinophagaceae bacterium]|nr:glycoside hydrolase family 127 protein [Chitinophagaceae bacterium]
IAAGLDTGSHKGPSFHDGDFYKMLEALASVYAVTRDKDLDEMMDKAIAVIGKSQREDGYIYTKSTIEQKNTGVKKQFESRLSFEAYNIGHLMTTACVHHRATGKTSLLDIAKKAADYLFRFYDTASAETARNAICPSHYMGLIELYRTTGDERYKALTKKLIDVRGISVGSDDNSDRYPLTKMEEVQGHAVRANYLFAGAADLYAETGDASLLNTLNRMWDDVVNHKMYVTGGCGSLYDGVSNDGTSYNPNDVEKLHQAYGRKYQLPNLTAHNETCANIGNVLWNWRMFQLKPDAEYADVVELALYNSVLSGISLDGKKFLYTNPLAYSDELPFKQRWSKDRVPYISLSNCCPPNVVRTIAEVSNYMYSISDKGIWINLYGGNKLSTKLDDGTIIKLTQETNYPWDGNINLQFDQTPNKAFSVFLRIPGWCKNAKILVNGKPYTTKTESGNYAEVNRKWQKGDRLQLILDMPVTMMEANPLVEETRNQVAVKRGPVVYCLESVDLQKNSSVFGLGIPVAAQFKIIPVKIANSSIVSLETTGEKITADWNGKLYKEISKQPAEKIKLKLIPYYAWGNRGHTEMSVWIPVR